MIEPEPPPMAPIAPMTPTILNHQVAFTNEDQYNPANLNAVLARQVVVGCSSSISHVARSTAHRHVPLSYSTHTYAHIYTHFSLLYRNKLAAIGIAS